MPSYFSRCFYLFLFIVLIACSNNKDKNEIKLLYETIKSAEKKSNVEEIYSLIDSESKTYLDSMSNKLLHADSVEVDKLNLFNEFMLLTFRDKAYEEIVHITGKELMINFHSTTTTMPKLMVGQNILKMEINDTIAIAYFGLKDFSTDNVMNLRFTKEQGKWRYNLISAYESYNLNTIELAFQGGGFKTKREYLETVLKRKGILKPYVELLEIPQMKRK